VADSNSLLPGFGRRSAALRNAIAMLLALAAAPTLAGPLTPQEEAGKKVFTEGVGATKIPIKALVGAHSSEVDGTTLPCASCHGPDALGRPEGAVKPSNITWPTLTKPYGHRSDSGRERGPYTDASFAEALTFGKDPSGNKLDPAMPRYVMANDDIANVLAYLKRIDADLDPGVSDDRLRIGTLLPTTGRAAEVAQAMRTVMQGQIEQINARGGLFGRKLELVVGELPEDRDAAEKAAERLMRDERVFAVVGPYAAGIEAPMFRLAEATGVPVVGPFTVSPDDGRAINRYTYYLLPGLRDQAFALAGFATKELGLSNPMAAIVHPDGEGEAELAAALEERLGERGWKRVLRVRYARQQMPAAKLVAALQQQGVQAVFFLGGDAELASLGKEVRDAIWTPYLLALGARVGPAAVNLPTTFGNRVFLAYPTLPADITPKGAQELAALANPMAAASGADHSMHGMPQGASGVERQRHQPARVSAYSAMLVLEEGLKRAGRDLSRAKFVAALDKLFSFETGVMPTITYGPNRRIGALGAHIVAADLTGHRFRRTGHYIRLD
jgi:ABC-type branched-subunit amino acid transport system substrate-binding protein